MFQNLSFIPPDPLFGLQDEFLSSCNTNKVNLGIGIFFTPEGKPFVFPSVQKAAKEIETANFNYLPMRGDKKFLDKVGQIMFGDFYSPQKFSSQQTCGGGHACDVFQSLVFRENKTARLLIGTPTWDNHYGIFSQFTPIEFPHLNDDFLVDFESYKTAIQNAQEGDFMLLHGGKTHNPTGVNLSLSQLNEIIELGNKKKIFFFIDYAYFGLGDGFNKDQEYSKIFAEKADYFAMGVSFSKNAALYRHRLGVLFIKTKDDQTSLINSHLENIIRQTISNPPGFGSMIMNIVFDQYFDEWKKELENVRLDISKRRESFIELAPEKFKHLLSTRGMFGMLHISPEQINILKKEYAVFIPQNSRVNFGGINPEKIPYVAQTLEKFTGTN